VLRAHEEVSGKRNLWAYFANPAISTSIAANIAEGYGRDNTGSYVQFLRVAQGSLKELETHVIIARRVGYMEASQEEDLLQRSDEVGKMLRALTRGLQRTI
jgi:four helix bundle protein